MKPRLSTSQRIGLIHLRDEFYAPPLSLRGNTLQALKRLGLAERMVRNHEVLWRRSKLGREELEREMPQEASDGR